jgi:hypothetical protein
VLVFFAGGWRSTRYTEDAVKIIESLGVAEHLALKMWTLLGSSASSSCGCPPLQPNTANVRDVSRTKSEARL